MAQQIINLNKYYPKKASEDDLSGNQNVVTDANGKITTETKITKTSQLTNDNNFTTATGHNHDSRYYTESEIDTKLNTKANTSHDHNDTYYTESEIDTKLNTKANSSHTHDDRYYTETEIDTKLNTKSNTSHNHDSTYIKKGVGTVTSTNIVNNTIMNDDIAENANIAYSKLTGVASDSHNHNDLYPTKEYVDTQLTQKADIDHTHENFLTEHQNITGKEDKSNKTTSISSSSTDTQYPSSKAVYNYAQPKGNYLTSHNPIDSSLSTTSTNAVQNKAVNTAINTKLDHTQPLQKDKVLVTNSSTGAIEFENKSEYIKKSSTSGYIKNDGTVGTPSNTTYSNATTTTAGLMSSTDKTKLNGVETGANKTVVDANLSSTSTNPVQNKVINTALKNIQNGVANINLVEIVSELPTTDIQTNRLYFKTSPHGDENLYDIYAYINDEWEQIDALNIDITEYLKKADLGAGTGLTKSETTLSANFGTTAGTICQGNDSRLSNARTPTAHAHGSLASGGTLNSDITSVNKVAVTDSSNNLKTISKVPFANINVTKSNITGLGIPAQDTTYSAATQSANGLMSSADKTKLDGIATGANKTTVDTALSSTSTNPVQNKVINTALSGKAASSHNHTTSEITDFPTDATTSTSGLMSSTDKTKLDGIATGANKYSHPSYTARTGKPTGNQTPAFGGTATVSQITSDASGHVTGATDRTITIPSNTATQSANGLMSSTDKTKLDGVATGANKYTHPSTHAASMITGLSTVATSGSYNDLSNKPTIPDAVSVTQTKTSGIEIGSITVGSTTTKLYQQDNNTTYSAATQSANGLMSSTDKTKLDGIATGANKTTVDSSLSTTSTNPVQNKVINTALRTKNVTVEKQTTAESGYTATYIVKQNGTQVGEKINIPKDFLVKSASLKKCTTANSPLSGLAVNDPYLDFVVNTKDNTGTDEHIYINVKDLVDTYTAGTGLTLSNNQFSLTDASNYVKKSSTSGYIKNDGSIGTPTNTTYSAGTGLTLSGTSFSLTDASNYVKKSSTSGYIKNDGTIGTPTNTTYTGSDGIKLDGTTFKHDSGTGTAQTTQSVYSIKFDKFGHINAATAVSSMTPTSHTHGNITNAGAIGSTANLPIITTTSGKLTTGSFGTTANTFCQGNDSRLSNTRTPTDGTVTNAKVASNAAIAFSKLNITKANITGLGISASDHTHPYVSTKMLCLFVDSNGISTEKYEVNVNDTMCVIIQIKDIKNNIILNTDVSLNVDKGYFIGMGYASYNSDNESWSITITNNQALNTKTITANTNNTGYAVALYKASESGLVTFKANDANIQCLVNGWEEIILTSSAGTSKLYVNDMLRLAEFYYSHSAAVTLKKANADTETLDTYSIIGTKYTPVVDNVTDIGSRHDYVLKLHNNGDVRYRVEEDHGLTGVYGHFMWHY